MQYFTGKYHGFAKVPLIVAALAVVLIATFYLRSSSAGKIVESFIDAPVRIPSGEIVSLTFNVVNKKADINTPIANLNYAFRVTPGADKVHITPSEAITDDNGNIYLSLNSQSGYKGEIVIWVLSEKHNLEKPGLHLHIGETK